MTRLFSTAFASLLLVACKGSEDDKPTAPPPAPKMRPVDAFPTALSPGCRGGVGKLYDECSDQREIFSAALKDANSKGKTLLVVYGAEWCIWCHVFNKYVRGQTRSFEYQFELEGKVQTFEFDETSSPALDEAAKALNDYVADNFVLVEIDSQYAPHGSDVLSDAGYDPETIESIPFIMAVNSHGKYTAHMPPYSSVPGLEIREDAGFDYRGFERQILLRELQKLRDSAK